MDMANSTVREMWSATKSLSRIDVESLNYFVSRKTNAFLEGFNSKISIIKNRAGGLINRVNFKNMNYFCMGRVSFPSYYVVLPTTKQRRILKNFIYYEE